jgi:prepilin-type N-terminal cleavage/methylation domain-containing protein
MVYMSKQIKTGRGGFFVSGFTLVELLVVLAIIALLIAILMPVLSRARRQAQVLASPIVYRGADKTLYLTDHRGAGDLQVYGRTLNPGPMNCPVCHSPPVWSPSGQSIAFHLDEPSGLGSTVLLNPSANRAKKWPEAGQTFFVSWGDSDHMVQTEMNRVRVNLVGANTNRIEQTFIASTPRDTPMFVAPAPASAPGPYIATMARNNIQPNSGNVGVAVLFLRKNFTPGKIVYQTVNLRPPDIEAPRVDLLGEFVAWTHRDNRGARVVAFKSVHDPMFQEPALIATRYQAAYFCDWGEDGNLLCNVSENGKWKLVVFDRKGREMRTLNTSTPPDEGYVATWRKYMHR